MTSMASTTSRVLASPSNPRIKSVARLRDRRERESSGLTLVDGAREVRRALDAGVEVIEAFVCEPLLAGEDARAALDGLRARNVPVTTTTEVAFAKIAFGDRAEGIVAVVRAPSLMLADLRLPDDPLVVVVEGVEKPGNVGAVLRSADGAGADALIAASPRTDLANPNVIRASAGTIFAVPLAAVPSGEVLAWLRERGLRVVAARVDAEMPYTDADLTGPLALVLGSETDGLTAAWRVDGVETVRLPMHGIADSLNVSVSAAILLYEARRQRDRHRDSPD
jgi:RNA methyltransferase, TrmH family